MASGAGAGATFPVFAAVRRAAAASLLAKLTGCRAARAATLKELLSQWEEENNSEGLILIHNWYIYIEMDVRWCKIMNDLMIYPGAKWEVDNFNLRLPQQTSPIGNHGSIFRFHLDEFNG